jgi:hypothetical protein
MIAATSVAREEQAAPAIALKARLLERWPRVGAAIVKAAPFARLQEALTIGTFPASFSP